MRGPHPALVLAALICLVAGGRADARTARAGIVDVELTSRSSATLESLAAQERFVEATGVAVAELRAETAHHGAPHPDTLRSLHRVGRIALLAGDIATAEDVLGAVADARKRVLPADDPAIAETLLRWGQAARYRGDRARARRCYDEAREILSKRGGRDLALEGERLQLDADWTRGIDEPGSIAIYRRALDLRRRTFGTPSFAVADNETWLAWTLALMGQGAEAVVHARDAAQQLDALGLSGHTLRSTLDNILADTLKLAGRFDEAQPFYRSTARRFADVRRRQWGGFTQRTVPLDGYESLALAAVRRGRGEEAWKLLETGRAATHVDFSSLGLWRRKDPGGFATWTAQRRELARARKRLLALSAGPPVWSPATAEAFLAALDLRARATASAEGYLRTHRPEVPSLEQLRSTLRPDEALVGWLDTWTGARPTIPTLALQSECWAFVVRPTSAIAWVRLWKNDTPVEHAEMTKPWWEVAGLLNRAATWPVRVDADPEIPRLMREWSRVNVDPILPHLKGAKRVILERYGMPELAVLPDGRTFGEMFETFYVPSAMTLVLLDEALGRNSASVDRPVLVVAGPTDTAPGPVNRLVSFAEAPSGHRGSRTAFNRRETPLELLPRLRYAGLEARSIAALFDRATLLGGNTAADDLALLAERNDLASFRVVHFATHTLSDGAPERCALALSDRTPPAEGGHAGVVEVEDILLRWQLDADLVTLSGCETLLAAGLGRGEPLGFTPAAFAAGARRVLSSWWPVDDRATTILMNRFYEDYTGRYADQRDGEVGRPLPAGRALREAKAYVRTLQDASGKRPYAHPVYWSSFFLFGLPD